MLLSITGACGDVSLASLLSIVKRIMLIIQIVVPILLILSTVIGITKLMADPENKKNTKSIINKFIAAAIVFFIPVFINVTMSIVGASSNFSSCWTDAEELTSPSVSYMSVSTNEKKRFINDGEYEPGNTNSDNSNSKEETINQAGTANRVIFLGDSRTVQLYAYMAGTWSNVNYSSGGVHDLGSDVYVAEGGKGLNWMKSTGIPAAKKYFTSGTALVILMGVNDLYQANSYINYINDNSSNWSSNGTRVYFASVNPCTGNYSRMNSNIESFNSKIRSSLNPNVGYIDTHSHLMSIGYNTTDGLHYDKDTSVKIYNYIKSHV